MREILFRGKRMDGIWEEGYYFAKPIVNYHCILSGENQYQVDPATVGQYTGLVDKNGRKIFEGDIVRCDNQKIGAVEYCPYEALFHVGTDPLQAFVWGTRNPETMKIEIEVIFNIHDNPELLEATPCSTK